MDTAGYDISSVTSMVAAGCQLVIFTTGRGTCTGNAIAPVLKVTANARTYQYVRVRFDWMSGREDGLILFQQCKRCHDRCDVCRCSWIYKNTVC